MPVCLWFLRGRERGFWDFQLYRSLEEKGTYTINGDELLT